MYSIAKGKVLSLFLTLCMVATLVSIPEVKVGASVATNVVISEVYGGGGNSGATFKNDFIELFNPTKNDINLDGWTFEYASKSGEFNGKTELTGTIKANGYYLIGQAAGNGGVKELPTVDCDGNISMAAKDCKVRLVDNNGVVIDFVGIGKANECEGEVAQGMSNTTSIQRKDSNGKDSGLDNSWDTNNNKNDFYSGEPNPRNSLYNGEETETPTPEEEGTISIAEARKSEIGTTVNIKGIITFKEASGSSFNYAIEDGTAGVALRGTQELELGDKVVIEGKLSEYKGLTQVQCTKVEVKSSNNTLPNPKEVKISDIINNDGGENVESQRVKINSVTIGEIKTTGNTILTDESGDTINIYKIPDITDVKEGDKVDVIGVCSQFTTYQIRVTQASDIKKSENQDTEKPDDEDKDGPILTVVTPGSLSTTNSKQTIKVSYEDESEINIDSLSFKVDNNDVTSLVEVEGKFIIFTPKENLTIGSHKFEVSLADIEGNSNTIEFDITVKEKVSSDGLNIYFGELHSHTNISDGAGSIEEAYRYAKEEAGVDFLAVTDHSNSIDNDKEASMGDGSMSPEWVKAHKTAKEFSDENFLGIYGYEMTWSNGIGHMNTFNTPGFESRNKDGLTNKDSDALENYYEILKQYPQSLSQFNHPGETFGDFNDFGSYDQQIDSLITLVEVGNGEGAVRSSGYFDSYDDYTRALDKGWHLAPTNNEDNHKGKWGNANTAKTVILAEDLSEESIYDAIRNMRVYATEDENLNIIYTLNDEIMGSILEESDTAKIKVQLKDENENIGNVSVIVNGGAVVASKTVDSKEGIVEFEIPADYSYYYIKIDQEDKDIAVTAPVWIGEVEKAGISKTEADTTMPIKGEEFEIESSLYNNESNKLTINSIEYSINGNVINSTSNDIIIDSLGTAKYKFNYTSDQAGEFTIDVKALGTIDGVEKTYTGILKINVKDPAVISKVVVDATHFNDYVAGYYANSMGNFTKIANENNMAVNIEKDKITNELLEDTQLLIITAPAKMQGTIEGVSYDPQSFSDEFIETIKTYADNGGEIIVCGIADYKDGKGELASSTQVNKLLKALNVSTRLNNDEVVDDDNNAGQPYRLKFNNINTDSEFLNGVLAEQVYSFYSGCSVSVNKDAISEGKAKWLVKGYDTTYSFDSNNNTEGVNIPKGEVVALASEKLSGGGNVFVAGTVFMSDFEVQASLDNAGDLQNSNYNIVMNIINNVKKEVKVTPIKDVREAAMGEVFCIEGYVTAGTQEGNAFFDTIYIQDETAGINIFPVANIDLQLGEKVKIIGSVSAYEGEKQIKLDSIEVIEDDIKVIEPKNVTTKEAALEENKGSLISVTGKVKELGEGYMILNDGSGDIRVFLNGYIGASDGSIEVGKFNESIIVEDTVTAVGLASTDTVGSRIRVRDSLEVVEEEGKETTITILHTNDSHGRVKAGWGTIGIDKIASFKNGIKNSLLIDAGDTLHGLPFATLNKGEDIVNLMKLAGYDLMTPGNHDFNYGYERLLELANIANKGENGFEIISANVLKDGNTILPATSIKEVDGVKIGFFGLSTPETTYKTNPNNVKGLEFIDPIETAKAQVEALEKQGVDVIIALAHIGTDKSSDVQSTMIAEEVSGIDIIVDGHSHSVYENGYEAANDTLIVSAGEHEKNLGKLELVINKETKKVESKKASLLNEEDFTEVTPDTNVTAGIEAIDAEQSIVLDEVIGNTLVTLDGEREQVRAGETNLGNLITDAMIYESGADIAITNGGGIRASINAGEITRGEIITTLPFGNYIVTKKLTGAEIKQVLEHGVQSYPETLGAFTHVAGLNFVFDDTKPVGERVVKITIDGKDIDMSKEYTVATNDFIAIGGDGYPCFADKEVENEFKGLDEALAAFVKHLGDVNYKVEGRITVGKANVEKPSTDEDDKEDDDDKVEVNPEEDGNEDTTVTPEEDTTPDKDEEKLPQTGGTNVIYLYALGVLLIIGGVIVFSKKKKQVNKQ